MARLQGWRLGWIGAGRMGTPLCRRLLAEGAALTVTDADVSRAEALAEEGARLAASIGVLAPEADILLSMVPNDAALLAVGTEVAAHAYGKLFIDLSTVSPAGSAQVAALMNEAGITYLRCPVSGSTETAAAGALTLFLSGPEAEMDRCAPLLSVLGKDVLRCGAAEEARVMKLMVNLMVAITPVIMGEALAFGSRLGLGWDAMVDAVVRSVAGSPLLAYKANMLKARDWTPAADIDLVAKDVDLALAAGLKACTPMPLSALARQFAAASQARGEGGQDFFSVATWPERLLAAHPR